MDKSFSEQARAEVEGFLFRGHKLHAIKAYRQATGAGLQEAKATIEQLEAELRASSPERFKVPQGKGCGLGLAVLIGSVAGAVLVSSLLGIVMS